MAPGRYQSVSGMVRYPVVLALCQNGLGLTAHGLRYRFPPIKSKVRVYRVSFVCAWTCCSSPDFFAPLVICDNPHFVLGKMPVDLLVVIIGFGERIRAVLV